MKINLNIANDVTYKHANFLYKIICVMGYTKIIKFHKSPHLKIYILRSTCLSSF
jgi:hypothetical protein